MIENPHPPIQFDSAMEDTIIVVNRTTKLILTTIRLVLHICAIVVLGDWFAFQTDGMYNRDDIIALAPLLDMGLALLCGDLFMDTSLAANTMHIPVLICAYIGPRDFVAPAAALASLMHCVAAVKLTIDFLIRLIDCLLEVQPPHESEGAYDILKDVPVGSVLLTDPVRSFWLTLRCKKMPSLLLIAHFVQTLCMSILTWDFYNHVLLYLGDDVVCHTSMGRVQIQSIKCHFTEAQVRTMWWVPPKRAVDSHRLHQACRTIVDRGWKTDVIGILLVPLLRCMWLYIPRTTWGPSYDQPDFPPNLDAIHYRIGALKLGTKVTCVEFVCIVLDFIGHCDDIPSKVPMSGLYPGDFIVSDKHKKSK